MANSGQDIHDVRREIRRKSFQSQIITAPECFGPDPHCKNKLIKAHVVSRKCHLKKIAENGRVVFPRGVGIRIEDPNLLIPWKEPIGTFKEVGWNQAGIFRAVCNRHDGIFYPIDNNSAIEDRHMNFLRSYRSSICQMAVDSFIYEQSERNTERILQSNVSTHTKSSAKRFVFRQRENFLRACAYKHEFDTMYRENDYSQLKYSEIELQTMRFSCVVSSCFTLDAYNPIDPPMVILNVFPHNNVTNVVFSSLSKNWDILNNYIAEFVHSSGVDQKRILSKIIIQNCGQIALNPSYWKEKTNADREKIVEFWSETHFWNDEVREDPAFMLF